MLELLSDHNFLGALSAMIGPLAFFAAPTGEIERLLLDDDDVFDIIDETTPQETPDLVPLGAARNEAA